MSDVALKPRGIEVNRIVTLAIQARAGFVSVCTRRLPEPLGRKAWLHAVRLLISAGLRVWPDLFVSMHEAVALGIEDAAHPAEEVA